MKWLQKQLIGTISPSLLNHGFVYISDQEMFIKTLVDVAYHFQVRCINKKGGILIEPGIGVRIELVEKIFHRTSGFEPGYQKWTSTIGAAIWRLEDKPKNFQYLLTGGESISNIARQLLSVFDTIALPYYSAYSSLEAIDHLLNDYPLKKTPHRTMEWLRASTGVIIAQLVGRDEYEKLKEEYRKKVACIDKGFYLPQFDALIEDLRSVERIL